MNLNISQFIWNGWKLKLNYKEFFPWKQNVVENVKSTTFNLFSFPTFVKRKNQKHEEDNMNQIKKQLEVHLLSSPKISLISYIKMFRYSNSPDPLIFKFLCSFSSFWSFGFPLSRTLNGRNCVLAKDEKFLTLYRVFLFTFLYVKIFRLLVFSFFVETKSL